MEALHALSLAITWERFRSGTMLKKVSISWSVGWKAAIAALTQVVYTAKLYPVATALFI